MLCHGQKHISTAHGEQWASKGQNKYKVVAYAHPGTTVTEIEWLDIHEPGPVEMMTVMGAPLIS